MSRNRHVMPMLVISTCPTCASKRIRRVKRSVQSKRGGEVFVARGIEVEECPDCGQRLFSPEAMEQVKAQWARSPKRSQRKKSA